VVHYETCVYRVVIDLSLASGWDAVAAHLQGSLTESEQTLRTIARTVDQLVRPDTEATRRGTVAARWFAPIREPSPTLGEEIAIPA
jgi:hypothetical protein